MNKKQIKNRLRNIYLMLIVFTLFLIMSGIVQAEEKARVAVLPFIIHSPEPMDHLRQDLQKMLTDSIIKKGLSGLNPSEVNKHGKAFQSSFLAEDLLGIGRDLNADWIIQGSLTQVRRKISLDIKIIDIKTAMPPLFLYMVEDDLDRLSNVADQAATSIYNQITGVVQLDDIQIYGNRRIADDAILALIQSKKGEELDRGKLDKDLRSIFSMGFFTDIAIETEDGPSGKIVTFKVTEKPAINEISFKGNKKVKAKDLSVETGIKQYSILNQSEIKQSINRLKDYYRQKGFYNVEIKEIIEPKPRNEVALTYMIEEGKEVYIREIQFIGNEKFDDDDLKDIMETSEKGFLSWFTKSGLLDRKKLEFDMNKIISFYHNHGFIRAKTGEPEITHNKEEDGLIITVEIIEDHQYTVNS
ncbi:POTRA domain-containing protein, partial [Thermodesulfobacteriota bacterium]